MTFNDFNLGSSLIEGLTSMGYVKPTPIQEQTIPILLAGKDLIACAQTGTGKTASYLLPVIHAMSSLEERHLNTLILAPTRELAQQIDQQVEGLAYFTGISSIAVYGGGDGMVYEQQRKAIIEGADIMIATPGRLISFLVSGVVKLDHLQHLVLDEADRMLDMGFYDDILKIMSYLPVNRQTMLFSATMPSRIRDLAKKILKDPVQVNISLSQPAEGIAQQAYFVHDEQKNKLLQKILAEGTYPSALIFASTKEKVKTLSQWFKKMNLPAEAFSSDLEQDERERILRAFKARQLPVIIGTDVLSRGIDVEGINLVLNYDVPPDPEDYIHRIGRTARAETTGTAITFVNEKDQRKFGSIEQLIGKEILKIPLPDEFGPAPNYNPKNGHRHPAASQTRTITKPYKTTHKVETPENEQVKSNSSEMGSAQLNENEELLVTAQAEDQANEHDLSEVPVQESSHPAGSSANPVKKVKPGRKGKSSARSRPPHKAGDPRPELQLNVQAAPGQPASPGSNQKQGPPASKPSKDAGKGRPNQQGQGGQKNNAKNQNSAGNRTSEPKSVISGRQHSGNAAGQQKKSLTGKNPEPKKEPKSSSPWDWLLFWKKK